LALVAQRLDAFAAYRLFVLFLHLQFTLSAKKRGAAKEGKLHLRGGCSRLQLFNLSVGHVSKRVKKFQQPLFGQGKLLVGLLQTQLMLAFDGTAIAQHCFEGKVKGHKR